MTNSLRTLLLTAVIAAFSLLGVPCFAQTKVGGDLDSFMKLSRGFSKLLNAPKNEASVESGVAVPEIVSAGQGVRAPIPRNVGLVFRIPSLNKFDESAEHFFQQTSDTKFSVLATLRLTAYRQVLSAIDPNAELAVMTFCDPVPPQFAIVLPVAEKNFSKFVDALAQTAPKDARQSSIGSDGKTANVTLFLGEPVVVVAKQLSSNYVALTQASDAGVLNEFSEENLVPNSTPIMSPALNDPTLTLEATPLGLKQLTEETRPFWREVSEQLRGLQKTLQDGAVDANLLEIRENIRQNLLAFRFDVSIDDYGIYAAAKTLPRPGSVNEKRGDFYKTLSPLNADADRFFTVLPDVEAPISGQHEIAPDLAASLPKPFNRLRFVEYSLNLPLESELAAESWQFFLEVDDADAFVKEMIIPKAREVGAYIGSKQIEDVGSQIFGAIAERRLERQYSRNRPPRRLADPEAAAARGAALGNLLGNAIGADSGEQMAMKKYKFDDYTMYISDLETYTRQINLKRAEEKGEVAREPGVDLIFNRNRPLLSALDVLMTNVQNGENFQNTLLRSANEKAEQVDSSPLFARKSNIIVLDKTHLVIGLGNQDLLHYAVNNWKSTSIPTIRYMSPTSETDGVYNMRKIFEQIPDPNASRFVSAIRLDLPTGQAYYRWIAQKHFPNAPQLNGESLPGGMPKALILSSAAGKEECSRIVAPLQTISAAFRTFSGGKTPLQTILQSQVGTKNVNSNVEELDDLFDE